MLRSNDDLAATRPVIRVRLAAIAVVAIVSGCSAPSTSHTVYDLVILNGRVMDPASGLGAIRAVGIASDGILLDGVGHPRVAGTFARVLGRYVRELAR